MFSFANFLYRHSRSLNTFASLYGEIVFKRFGIASQGGSNPKEFPLRLLDRPISMHMRPNTTDLSCLSEIFFQEIYRLKDIQPPKTILDIGANIGLASIYFALRYPDAKVHAVEPMKANHAVLSANARDNFPDRITCYQIGISDRDTTLRFDLPKDGSYWGFSKAKEGHTHATEEVKVRSLDTFLKDIGNPQIDLLKLDAEGAEFDLLRTSREILIKIPTIIGELHTKEGDAVEFLAQLNETHVIDFNKTFGEAAFLFTAIKRQ